MRLPLILAGILILILSCTQTKLVYTDKVKDSDTVDPKLTELFTHWYVSDRPKDDGDLVRTWYEWLGDKTVPLYTDGLMTFVYYDFTHKYSEISLKASFSSESLPLKEFGTTGLFYRVFQLPKLSSLTYQYVAGPQGQETILPDPFHFLVSSWDPPIQKTLDMSDKSSLYIRIDGNAEGSLKGLSFKVLLPSGYFRNLSTSYPVLYVIGMNENNWEQPLDAGFQAGSLQPVITVVMNPDFMNEKNMSQELIQVVKSWLDRKYRTLSDRQNSLLLGWAYGSEKVEQNFSSAGETFANRIAISDKEKPVWATSIVPLLQRIFPLVKPTEAP